MTPCLGAISVLYVLTRDGKVTQNTECERHEYVVSALKGNLWVDYVRTADRDEAERILKVAWILSR